MAATKCTCGYTVQVPEVCTNAMAFTGDCPACGARVRVRLRSIEVAGQGFGPWSPKMKAAA